mmetsp:Transcript_37158/g.119188  ORF Transcript_37158/g.119188 Transcript_37158/m.119188 type:complete len:319 (-) Transcript_37158:275-1231(-)
MGGVPLLRRRQEAESLDLILPPDDGLGVAHGLASRLRQASFRRPRPLRQNCHGPVHRLPVPPPRLRLARSLRALSEPHHEDARRERVEFRPRHSSHRLPRVPPPRGLRPLQAQGHDALPSDASRLEAHPRLSSAPEPLLPLIGRRAGARRLLHRRRLRQHQLRQDRLQRRRPHQTQVHAGLHPPQKPLRQTPLPLGQDPARLLPHGDAPLRPRHHRPLQEAPPGPVTPHHRQVHAHRKQLQKAIRGLRLRRQIIICDVRHSIETSLKPTRIPIDRSVGRAVGVIQRELSFLFILVHPSSSSSSSCHQKKPLLTGWLAG